MKSAVPVNRCDVSDDRRRFRPLGGGKMLEQSPEVIAAADGAALSVQEVARLVSAAGVTA